jgi:hypothetical protein
MRLGAFSTTEAWQQDLILQYLLGVDGAHEVVEKLQVA